MDKRNELKRLLNMLNHSDWMKVKMLYPRIGGNNVEDFVNNATDSQVIGIINLCEIQLKLKPLR